MRAAPAGPSRETSRAATAKPKVELPAAKTAVDLVNELATDGWRRTVADKLSGYLDDEAATLLDRSWTASRCKKLAKAARKMERLSGQFDTLDGVLASQSARAAAAGSDLATALLERALSFHSPASLSFHSPVDTLARGLRACGISLCAIHGCMGSCQCLKDLCEDTVLPKLQNAIDEALDRLLVRGQATR